MPGAVARTSTYALTNATLPYILILANLGFEKAVQNHYPLYRSLNMVKGELTIKEVADAFGLRWR
jgi:alanine dehydrogenase